ncbi:MAG: alcohol dehydrogenase [Ignavibacteriales bacterium]|nr:MAG: alcohol dehydrogenase [Ignavibacteriales bacterium]
MKAFVINEIKNLSVDMRPLESIELPEPKPEQDEIVIKVSACGVCHTELDEIEGRTPPPKFPVVPGHQIVGKVIHTGKYVKKFKVGSRVGIGWINSSCGNCEHCLQGNDNLCNEFKATGRDVNGGYAEFTKVKENYAFDIPGFLSDAEAAPLLCAGAIGYRSLRLTNLNNNQILGLTGFGASAHLVLKVAKYLYKDLKVFVFARSEKEREFAKELGADWTGDTDETPPEMINSIIDTTPVWKPIVKALEFLQPGGRLVINAIRKESIDKSELLNINYEKHLWMEKEIKSVANVASKDISEFLEVVSRLKIKPEVELYNLEDANIALVDLKERRIRGAKVLVIK